MQELNKAVEGASEFIDFMGKVIRKNNLTDQNSHVSLGINRLPGENRAMHRERLKRERRGRVKA